MDESICVVYDNLVPISSLHKYFLDKLPLKLMRQKLQPPTNLPTLLNRYVFQPPCKILKGMSLSTSEILSHPPLLLSSPQFSIYTTCFESLKKVSYNGPPQFTIANKLYMGMLPKNFHSLTRTNIGYDNIGLE
jgi:hypothetical protein